MMSNGIGECKLCGSKAKYLCQRCRESYCSTLCQTTDWPAHKTICFPMPFLIPMSSMLSSSYVSSTTTECNYTNRSQTPLAQIMCSTGKSPSKEENGMPSSPESPPLSPSSAVLPTSTQNASTSVFNFSVTRNEDNLRNINMNTINLHKTVVTPINNKTSSNVVKKNVGLSSPAANRDEEIQVKKTAVSKENLMIDNKNINSNQIVSSTTTNNKNSSNDKIASEKPTNNEKMQELFDNMLSNCTIHEKSMELISTFVSDVSDIGKISNSKPSAMDISIQNNENGSVLSSETQLHWNIPFPIYNDSTTDQTVNEYFNVIIQFVMLDNAGIYWATQCSLEKECDKLLREINKTVLKLSNCMAGDIEVNKLYAVPFEGIYYRGTVINEQITSTNGKYLIRLIDYGNEFYSNGIDFKPAIPLMKNLNAFAFPMKIRDPPKGLQLNIGDKLKIKMMARDYNHEYIPEIYIVKIFTENDLGDLKRPEVAEKQKQPAAAAAAAGIIDLKAPSSLPPSPASPRSTLYKMMELNSSIDEQQSNLVILRSILKEEKMAICILVGKCLKTLFKSLTINLPQKCTEQESSNDDGQPNKIIKSYEMGEFVCGKTVANGWERGFILAKYKNHYIFMGCDSGTIEIIDKCQSIPNEYQHLEYLTIILDIENVLINEFEFRTQYFNVNSSLNVDILWNSSTIASSNNHQMENPIKCIIKKDNIQLANGVLRNRLFTFQELALPFWPIPPQPSTVIAYNVTHINETGTNINICPINKVNYLNGFINDYIMNDNLIGLQHKTVPQNNEMILYSKYNNDIKKNEYYRGLIVGGGDGGISVSDKLQINNIDIGGMETEISIKNCYHINNFLHYAPVYTCQISLQNIQIDKLEIHKQIEIINYFNELKLNKTAFIINFYSSYKNTVELVYLDTNKSLNKYLNMQFIQNNTINTNLKMLMTDELKKIDDNKISTQLNSVQSIEKCSGVIEKKKIESLNNNSSIASINDIELIPLTTKLTTSIMLLCLDSSNLENGYITACEFNEKELQKMDEHVGKINEYCSSINNNTTTTVGYKPKVNEICFGIYDIDKNWYRANCLKIIDDTEFLLMFIDYGNIVKTNWKNIRKFNMDFAYSSIANTCLFKDIEEMSPPIVTKICDYLKIHPLFQVDAVEETGERNIYYIKSKSLIQYLISH